MDPTPVIPGIFQLAGWSIAIWFIIRSIWKYDGNEKKLIELALNSTVHWEQCSSNYRSVGGHLEQNDKDIDELFGDMKDAKKSIVDIDKRLSNVETKCKIEHNG